MQDTGGEEIFRASENHKVETREGCLLVISRVEQCLQKRLRGDGGFHFEKDVVTNC